MTVVFPTIYENTSDTTKLFVYQQSLKIEVFFKEVNNAATQHGSHVYFNIAHLSFIFV